MECTIAPGTPSRAPHGIISHDIWNENQVIIRIRLFENFQSLLSKHLWNAIKPMCTLSIHSMSSVMIKCHHWDGFHCMDCMPLVNIWPVLLQMVKSLTFGPEDLWWRRANQKIFSKVIYRHLFEEKKIFWECIFWRNNLLAYRHLSGSVRNKFFWHILVRDATENWQLNSKKCGIRGG